MQQAVWTVDEACNRLEVGGLQWPGNQQVIAALRQQAAALAASEAVLAHRWECQQSLERTVQALRGDVAAMQARVDGLEAAQIEAYDAGFMASGEGWNGEYGPDTDSHYYLEKRNEYFAAIAARR